ncbi:MAG: hypothetical protein KUL82_02220 [Bdellovibrio sp.]|nr:hypothetical protein [Bdellovibrio sp.]
MKLFLTTLAFLLGSSAFAEEPTVKPHSFIDVVYKIKTQNGKSLITFYRAPTLYEIPEVKDVTLLRKLEASQKDKKPIRVTVDPLTRKILSIKAP